MIGGINPEQMQGVGKRHHHHKHDMEGQKPGQQPPGMDQGMPGMDQGGVPGMDGGGVPGMDGGTQGPQGEQEKLSQLADKIAQMPKGTQETREAVHQLVQGLSPEEKQQVHQMVHQKREQMGAFNGGMGGGTDQGNAGNAIPNNAINIPGQGQ